MDEESKQCPVVSSDFLILLKLMNCWWYSGGHFQLKILYCDDILDISQIIKSQTELQILGLYAPGENLLKTLKHFHDAQLFPPTIFTLDCEFHSVITIFPAFYSVDRITTIHQLLAKSFDECQSYNDAWDDVNEVNDLSAYLIDCSDMPTIHALAKGIARCFPQIRYIPFNFERRCEIVSFSLTNRLLLPQLILSIFSHHMKWRKFYLYFLIWKQCSSTSGLDIMKMYFYRILKILGWLMWKYGGLHALNSI